MSNSNQKLSKIIKNFFKGLKCIYFLQFMVFKNKGTKFKNTFLVFLYFEWYDRWSRLNFFYAEKFARARYLWKFSIFFLFLFYENTFSFETGPANKVTPEKHFHQNRKSKKTPGKTLTGWLSKEYFSTFNNAELSSYF